MIFHSLKGLTMMYTFKSKAAANMTIAQADGDRLLQIIGKTPQAQGIVEVAELPAAIQALENAVAREAANRRPSAAQPSSQTPETSAAEVQVVEPHRRIWPFVEMLKRARDEGDVIVWGV